MDRLVGVVRSYDWGSSDALALLRGTDPTGLPEAELWFGSHPAAPSVFAGDGRRATPLDLPILSKFLAVERALSLQVHPDDPAAAVGYRAEEEAGLATTDPRRSFTDPTGKPELLIAVSEFSTLCGLRPMPEATAAAEALEMPVGVVDRLRAGDRHGAVTAALASVGSTESTKLLKAARLAGPSIMTKEHLEVLKKLGFEHPDDPALLVVPLMRHMVLEPGEAIFVVPGMLHSHLSGLALEVMAPSDSVVRAGLTSKHVNVDAAVHLLNVEAEPQILRPKGSDFRYDLLSQPFNVRRLHLASGQADEMRPAVVICSDGSVSLLANEGKRERLLLGPGEAAWLGDEDGVVELSADGTAYIISGRKEATSSKLASGD